MRQCKDTLFIINLNKKLMSKEANKFLDKIGLNPYHGIHSYQLRDLLTDFAEEYHQSKLNEVSEEDIEFERDMNYSYGIGQEGTYEEGKYRGFEDGVEWLLNKLKKG